MPNSVRALAEEIVALAKKATPEPWERGMSDGVYGRGGWPNVCGLWDGGQTRESIDANGEFIVAARSAAPVVARAYLELRGAVQTFLEHGVAPGQSQEKVIWEVTQGSLGVLWAALSAGEEER